MCKLLEDMRKAAAVEARYNEKVEMAKRMLAAGRYSCEEISELTKLSLDEVERLKGKTA